MIMQELLKITDSNWSWEIIDKDIISSILEEIKNPKNIVKISSNRIISIMRYKNENYYIKYDKPEQAFIQIKRIIKSKVKSEFYSALLFAGTDIKFAEFIGYGISRSSGIIISKEVKNSRNARDFWFSEVAGDKDKEDKYIKQFIIFLGHIFRANIYHPDFHLGNILIDIKTYEFIIIDPYGISKKKALSEKKEFEMLHIISTFRNSLSNSQIGEMLISLNIADNQGKAKMLWNNILKSTGKKNRQNWGKREKQILEHNNKYIEVVKNKQQQLFLLKKSQSRKTFVSASIINNVKSLEKKFIKKEYPKDVIEKVWLSSFCLQFHEINHQKPLIFDIENSVLYFEKLENECKIKNFDAEREFLSRLKLAGFKIKNIESKIVESNNKIYLKL